MGQPAQTKTTVAQTQQSVSKISPKVECLLEGLAQTEEQAYAKFVAKSYGFSLSNSWDKTKDRIRNDIASQESSKVNCNEANLETLVDRVITSAEQQYRIYNVSSADMIKMRSAIHATNISKHQSVYSGLYPEIVDFDKNPKAPTGDYLCKIKDLGDGIYCIFATIIKEKAKGKKALSSLMVSNLYYNCVFIPHNSNHIEIRLSRKANAKQHARFFSKIEQELVNLLGDQKVVVKLSPINVYKTIASFFADKTAGRAVHAVMSTDKSGNDAELKNFKSPIYCARTQKVEDTQGKNTYVCRSVVLRWENTIDKKEFVDLGIVPYKYDWENEDCFDFYVKRPSNSTNLENIISDVLSRA